jgi:tRNA (adenine57-N1/adenine58-N1)-methyltransferase
MYETLLRPIEVSAVPKLPSIEDATERLKQAEIKREDKRQKQIKANREKEARDKAKKEKDAGAVVGEKRKYPDGEPTTELDNTEGSLPVVDDAEEGVEPKRAKTQESGLVDNTMHVDPSSNPTPVPEPLPITLPVINSASIDSSSKNGTPSSSSPGPGGPKMSVSKALSEVRGHTSYLTFACLVPYGHALKSGDATSAAASKSSADVENTATVGEGGGSAGNGKSTAPSAVSASSTTETSTENAEPGKKAD